jgi:hypothetical protein
MARRSTVSSRRLKSGNADTYLYPPAPLAMDFGGAVNELDTNLFNFLNTNQCANTAAQAVVVLGCSTPR